MARVAAADLIANSMLAATRARRAWAARSWRWSMPPVFASTCPAATINYDEAFAMMPFGNNLVVMTLTGAQLKAALEQQYAVPIRAGSSRSQRSHRRRGSLTPST